MQLPVTKGQRTPACPGTMDAGMAAESPPTCLAQLLCRTGEGRAWPPTQLPSPGSIEGPSLIPSSFPHSHLSDTHTGCHLLRSVPHTHTNTSCHIPHKHSSATHAVCVPHTQSWPQQGLLTYRVSSPAIPTLCLTHNTVSPAPIHTRSVIQLQESLYPDLSQGLRHP